MPRTVSSFCEPLAAIKWAPLHDATKTSETSNALPGLPTASTAGLVTIKADCFAGGATCCTAARPCTRLVTTRRNSLHAGVTLGCRAVLSPELVFTAATVAVMPIYTMMIGFQHHPQVS